MLELSGQSSGDVGSTLVPQNEGALRASANHQNPVTITVSPLQKGIQISEEASLPQQVLSPKERVVAAAYKYAEKLYNTLRPQSEHPELLRSEVMTNLRAILLGLRKKFGPLVAHPDLVEQELDALMQPK